MDGKKFIPVIHVSSMDQMMRNLTIIVKSNADGVFLINNGSMNSYDLIQLYNKATEEYPDLWIGINCLDLSGYEVFQHVPPSIDGVWVDDGGVQDGSTRHAKLIDRSKKGSGFSGMYFGGVAFKGQGYFKNVKKDAKKATKYIDIITTSGPGTGQEASVEKVVSMKDAIGDRPLALASGITIDNIGNYLPYVEYFLVATGISSSFYELDPVKVQTMATLIHEY